MNPRKRLALGSARSTASTRGQSLLAAAVGVFVVGLIWWPLVLIAGGGLTVGSMLVPRIKVRRQEEARAAALPTVIDLILIAISSGETISGALRLVAGTGPAAVRSAFAAAIMRLDRGGTLPDTLTDLTAELGSGYRSLLTSLTQAEREGSPVGALLIRLSDEAATARRRQAERTARRLPVQMLIPLVFCSLPAVIVGAVVPLVVVSLRRL